MKPLFAFLALFFILQNACAQNDKASVGFIRTVFHEKNVRYLDSLGGDRIDEMKSLFDDQFQSKFFRALKITKPEKNYIDNQLKLLKHFTWKPGLFENSKLVASDTIERLYYKIDSAEKRRFYIDVPVYGFSKPIFLRQHSICFFYQERDCGSLCGGSGHFFVYIKQKRGWVLWTSFYDWIS